MPQIEAIATSTTYTVAETPVWANGVWGCGDQRFVDPNKTIYQPVVGLGSYPLLTALQYYNAFTVQEAIAIKSSTDPIVQEILYRLNQAITSNTPVDPNSVPVQAGLTYLSTNPSGSPLIAPSRLPAICAGTPQ